MRQTIKAVQEGSVCSRAGIEAGDTLLCINGERVHDLIDYQYLEAARELSLEIEKRSGAKQLIKIKKSTYEPLGLGFENSLMSPQRSCANHCVFCFVDQLPPDVRSSLCYKDDDWRLSFIMGNYVTLTNVSDAELERITRRHVSPLYISVHTTNGALREKMMGSRAAAKIMDQLAFLGAAGIRFHTQAVLCPGWNDGDELLRTIGDLSADESALSLAVVPVGLSGYRHGLEPLGEFTRDGAAVVLSQIEAFQERLLKTRGTRFVFAADELYLKAGQSPPDYDSYEGFEQIENGVGLMRLFEREVIDALGEKSVCGRYSIATGTLAAPFMQGIARLVSENNNELSLKVYEVKNTFFGESITVAGLLTGADLLAQLSGKDLGQKLLVPRCMLKEREDVFLCGMTLKELEQKLGAHVEPVEVNGAAFLNALSAL